LQCPDSSPDFGSPSACRSAFINVRGASVGICIHCTLYTVGLHVKHSHTNATIFIEHKHKGLLL